MGWQWTTASYAAAGAALAAVPIALHLLRRRHARRIAWGPMHLLRKAAVKERPWLRLRDRLLLALRILLLIAFGCALARPRAALPGRWSGDSSRTALLLIDNSLSMAARHLGTTRLDAGLARAEEVFEGLPAGTELMVLPVCGPEPDGRRLRYQAQADVALAASDFPLVEDSADLPQIVRRLDAVWTQVSPPPDQIYLITDMQAHNWQFADVWDPDRPPLQVVDVGLDHSPNAWIESIQTWPRVAVPGESVQVYVQVAAAGSGLPAETEVRLEVEGERVERCHVATPADGQSVVVPFTITVPPRSAESPTADALDLRASISPDTLLDDNVDAVRIGLLEESRIVFVDQWDEARERIDEGRVGSTYSLRRLWTAFGRPAASHAAVDKLDRQLLQPYDVVVMAGVEDPRAVVSLLREWVIQGGQLLIAPGQRIDVAAWQQHAWLDGEGILPAPLDIAGGAAASFDPPARLDWQSMASESWFQIPGLGPQELLQLAAEPLILQAVPIAWSEEVARNVVARELNRWRPLLGRVGSPVGTSVDWAAAYGVTAWRERQARETHLMEQIGALDRPMAEEALTRFAERMAPRVVARLANGQVLAVERRMGAGKILFWGTTFEPQWNTWAATNAVLFWQQILDQMLQESAGAIEVRPGERAVIPYRSVNPADDPPTGPFQLRRPDGQVDNSVEWRTLTGGGWAFVCRNLWRRGVYEIHDANSVVVAKFVVRDPFAARAESNLAKANPSIVRQVTQQSEERSIAVVPARLGTDWVWWYLTWLVLALLLLELLVLSWRRRGISMTSSVSVNAAQWHANIERTSLPTDAAAPLAGRG